VSRGSRHYSLDDYFAVEQISEVRHEYWDGGIFAMAGASLPHNEIAANVLSELRARLRESDCGAFGSDLRVCTPAGLYTYPDVSVVCGRVQLVPDRSDTATNPFVIAEVLSEATEEYDRGDKFALYRSIPSLRHYILISQTGVRVDHFHRIDPDEWPCRSMRAPDDRVEIRELGVSFALADAYRRVF
jgi:Uma2 family endonuclease